VKNSIKNTVAVLAFITTSFSFAHHGSSVLATPPVESQVNHSHSLNSSAGISLRGDKIYQTASQQSSCFVDVIKKVEALAQDTNSRFLVGEIENKLRYAPGSAGFLVSLNTRGIHHQPHSVTVTFKSHRLRDTHYNVSSQIQLDRNGRCSEESTQQLFLDLIEQVQNILTINFHDASFENHQDNLISSEIAI